MAGHCTWVINLSKRGWNLLEGELGVECVRNTIQVMHNRARDTLTLPKPNRSTNQDNVKFNNTTVTLFIIYDIKSNLDLTPNFKNTFKKNLLFGVFSSFYIISNPRRRPLHSTLLPSSNWIIDCSSSEFLQKMRRSNSSEKIFYFQLWMTIRIRDRLVKAVYNNFTQWYWVRR